MSKLDDRLAELGLTVPTTSKPVAAYIPAVASGNLVYTSGQLPMVDGALPMTGKVGVEVDADAAKQLARTCVLNGLAAARSAIGSLDRITRVVAMFSDSRSMVAMRRMVGKDEKSSGR